MNFKHSKNLQESIDGMKKIFSISWSPNLMRLAVAHVDEKRNVRITLYDENGDKQESFPTRPANKNNKSYVVREIAFSPDSTKLAVSQSDNIVFIYNLGSKWGDKKTICNKFEQNTQVTTMIWPQNKTNELYFGVAEGKVKAGILKSNYAQILYSTETYVVSLCASSCGKFILSGHIDQSIWKHSLETGSTSKIITFSSIPYCVSWTHSILVAGNDAKVCFFSDAGESVQSFDYAADAAVKDFTVSRSNNTGELIAVGNFDKFFVFMFNAKKNNWEEALVKRIPNYFTITAMCWRPDISSLVTGSLCGSLDIFESCLKKSRYGDNFELIYLSHSQLMIKSLEDSKRIVLKSLLNSEIVKVNIFYNQYILLVTKDSLIFGDINSTLGGASGQSAEIAWSFSGNEKFDFSNPSICMIHNSGEIAIVEYGINEVIGYCRTEHTHSNLISARVNYLKNPFSRRLESAATSNNFSANQNSNLTLNNLNTLTANNNNIATANVFFNSPNNTQQNGFISSKINYFNANTNTNLNLNANGNTNTNFFNTNQNNTGNNTQTGFALSNKANLPSIKLIAYLVDSMTIHIQDLQTQSILNKIYHESNIEFLDLSKNATKLIFRDDKRCLYIYYLEQSKKEILLNFCGFVQWVPHTDVLVAQDQKNLYVWYHIEDYENYKVIPIKGEAEEVRRTQGKTEVLVEEFGETQIYLLDENLISLFQAIENYSLAEALMIIESISFEAKAVADVYWKSIARKALEEFSATKDKKFISIVQRCYGAVGAYSRVKYLKDLAKKIQIAEGDASSNNNNNYENKNNLFTNEILLIQAKLFILDKQFVNAENLLVLNNMEREAIQLLNEYKKYEDSLRIAERFGFSAEAQEIKEKYQSYLLESKAFDKAGLQYEKDGNFEAAIKLYIENNFCINAVNLIMREKNNPSFKNFSKENIDKKLVDFLANSLVACGLNEKCAQFISEISDDVNFAVDLFLRGNCFEKALNLAKKNLLVLSSSKSAKGAGILSKIEESWGDSLFNQGNYEQAIPHFLESSKIEKAIGCFINIKKWPKAIELMEQLEDEKLCKEFNLKIAENFRKEKNLAQAEVYFKKANEPEKILELYIDLLAWDKLESLLAQYDFNKQLLSYAAKLEAKGKLKEAEKVYLYANEPDMAIKMYKSVKHYDEMILLVKKYLPQLLDKTYDMLGDLCEKEFNFKKAEDYYSKTNNPNKAVEMYFANNLIEEGLKLLSKLYFSNFDVIEKIIADYKNNFGLNFDDLIKVITKLNYHELAIRLECLQGNYDKAKAIAEAHAKEHLSVINFSIAEDLNIKKNYFKAEEFYIKAKKFNNAITMFEEINDFNSAFRLARKYNKSILPRLHEKEGFFRLGLKEYENSEICFNKAGKAEIMYQTYLSLNLTEKANEYARKYCPELIADSALVNKRILPNLDTYNEDNNFTQNNYSNNTPLSSVADMLGNSEKFESEGKMKDAIESYFEIANSYEPKQKEAIINVLVRIENLLKASFNNNLTAVGNKSNKNFFHNAANQQQKISENEKNNYLEALVHRYLLLEEYRKAGDLLNSSNQLSRALNSYMLGSLENECNELIETATGQLKQQLIAIYTAKKNANSNNNNNYNNKNENFKKVNNNNKDAKNNINFEINYDSIDEAQFVQSVYALFEKGNYEEILMHFKNRNKDTEIFTKVFVQIANVFFNSKNYLDFCFLLNKTDINLTNKTVFVLKNLSMEILAEENSDEIENLKLLMDKRFKSFSDPSVVNSAEESSELIRLHKISHFQNIKISLSSYISKFKDLYFALNMSLLQYGDVLNLDKIILEVVKIGKHTNNIGTSYVMTNKYLDLMEFLENGVEIENDEQSLLTNIPWKNAFLSEKNVLTKEEMNEMKNWVVQMSIQKDLEKNFNAWNCFKCNSENFEGNSVCVKCNYKFDQCIMSGLAIRENSNQSYKSCIGCHRKALDKYWKDWFSLFKYCPWCKKIYK